MSVDLEQDMVAKPPIGPPVIELREVGRTFPGPPPVEAFKPSNLTIDQGEYVSIIGPSGSGKSTLQSSKAIFIFEARVVEASL